MAGYRAIHVAQACGLSRDGVSTHRRPASSGVEQQLTWANVEDHAAYMLVLPDDRIPTYLQTAGVDL